MSNYDFILDSIVWSYSSVNLFNTCPRAFKLIYLDAVGRDDNNFGQWGSLMHHLMERYFNGEHDVSKLIDEYEFSYYNMVTGSWPYNKYCDLGEKYYKSGIDYLSSFEGLYNDYEIIGIENKFRLNIDDRPDLNMVGIVDLVLKNPDTGKIIIVDHKSKSAFKSKRELAEYARQLYIYSDYYIRDNIIPEKLVFHSFRGDEKLIEIPFNMDDYHSAKKWFLTSINNIRNENEYDSVINIHRKNIFDLNENHSDEPDYEKRVKKEQSQINSHKFYCDEICSARSHCTESRYCTMWQFG